jgi:hypothetical protein
MEISAAGISFGRQVVRTSQILKLRGLHNLLWHVPESVFALIVSKILICSGS